MLSEVFCKYAWTIAIVVAVVFAMQHEALGQAKEPGTVYLSLPLPEPIRNEEADLWAEVLAVSEAQRAVLSQQLAVYENQVQREYVDEARELWARSAAIAADGPVIENPELAREFGRLLQDTGDVVSELDRLERILFEHLAMYLGESQLEILPVAKGERSRRRALDSFTTHIPGAQIDLIRLLAGIVLVTEDLQDDAILRGSTALAYTHEATPRVEKAADTRIRSQAEFRVLQSQVVVGAIAEDAYHKGREALLHPVARAQVVLGELNLRYLDRFCAELPEPVAAEFRDGFMQLAFRNLFPDRNDTTGLVEAVQELQLTEGERVAIREIAAVDVGRRNAVTKKMMTRMIEWREHTIEFSGYRGGMFDAFKADMHALEAERGEAADNLISQVRQLLGDARMEAVAGALRTIESNRAAPFQADPRLRGS